MSTVNEQPKEEVWNEILSNTIKSLESIETSKRPIIANACKLLEESGMPLHMICAKVVRELSGYVSRKTLYEAIDDKYKDVAESRKYGKKTPEESTTRGAQIDDKKHLEHGDGKAKRKDVKIEEEEIYQIRVEDYRIEDVEKYDRPFLIKLVMYLNDTVRDLEAQLATPRSKRK